MSSNRFVSRRVSRWLLAALLIAGCSSKESEIAVEEPVEDAGCVPSCGDRTCGPDGCGGTCGSCGATERCNEQWRCEAICVPEIAEQLCARNELECGSATLTDNCGDERTVDCGTCTLPETCDAATRRCRCVPESNEEFCAAQNIQCGAASGDDTCGAARVIGECGPCPARYDCKASACQPCLKQSDAELCLAANATCGSLVTYDGCGDSRTIQSCGDCSLPEFCDTSTLRCGPAPVPANDDCAGAEVLQFVDRLAAVAGQTTGATESGSSRACASSGADVVYVFTTSERVNLDVRLTPTVAIDSVVSLRTACSDNTTELTCSLTSSGPGSPNGISVPRLPAGTYYLWVDSNQAPFGVPFTLEVVLGELPAPPPNDTCAGATVLAFTGPSAEAQGATWDANDDYQSSCGIFDGPDVVFQLNLATDSAVTIDLESGANSERGFSPAVYLRSTCDSNAPADQLQCTVVANGVASLRLPVVAAGTYYLVVDSANGARGSFTLDVHAGGALHNDACPAAEALTFNTIDVAFVLGDTGAATDDSLGSCSLSGRDLVYSFEMDRLGTADIQIDATGSPLRPAVYIRSACDSGELPNGCAAAAAAGGTATLSIPRLTQGTWYVWVDGNGSGAGAFTLQVTRHDAPAPPAHDSCSQPEAFPLNRVTGTGSVTGTTMWATDDSTGSCGAMTGHDLVYAVTTTTDSMLSVRVVRDPADTLYVPAVVVRRFCPIASDELACGVDVNGTASAVTTLLPAGIYFVIVDGMTSSFGRFTLEVTASPPPGNDTCAAPAQLIFDGAGVATVTGDSNQGLDSYSAVCATSPGKDLVYAFTIGQAQKVEATVLPISGSLMRHVVAVRSSCEAAGSERACAKATTDGGAATATSNRLEAGTYYVLVDGTADTANGPFTLTVTLSTPPVAPANDDCAAAEVLTFDGTGTARATGTTVNAGDDQTGTCATSSFLLNGNDVAYAVTLTATAQLTAKITRDTASGSYTPAVYIRTACGRASSDEIACSRGNNASAIGAFPAGTYYVIVDGQNGSAGGFTLEVKKGTAVAGDGCLNPLPLTFDRTGVATATGTTATANSSSDGPCNPLASALGTKDLVYTFTLTSVMNVAIDARAASGSIYRPLVYVRSSCGDSATQVTCAYSNVNNTPVATSTGPLAAGTYYLWVDSSGQLGAFEVTLTETAPQTVPANDLCATAQTLGFDPISGWVEVTGDTTWATNDSQGTCGQHDGPDLVYAFTVAATSMFAASIAPNVTTAGFQPALYLRSDCANGASSAELACANSGIDGLGNLSVPSLAPGTYYLVVDGLPGGTSGKFVLDAILRAPSPNDECAGAEPLVFDGAGFAVTSGDGARATVGSPGSCSSGPDLVYTFTTGAEKTLDLLITPGSTVQPVLYVRSACDVAGSEVPAGCLKGTKGALLSMRVPRLAAGTWYVWVAGGTTGGVDLNNGPFRLEAHLSTPQASPANDACTAAEALTFDLSNIARASGDTTFATSTLPGTCDVAPGPDVVYSFTIGSAQKVTAKATRNAASPSFKPTVSIRTDCARTDDAAELACGRSNSTTGVSTAVANSLSPGTYYVWVDGAAGTFGQFDLEVTLAAAVSSPANDICATAQALVFTGNTVTVAGSAVGAQDDAMGSCGPLAAAPDVVFSFVLSAPQKVTAETAPTTYSPKLYIRAGCGSAASTNELACNFTMASNTRVTATANLLPPGTYYVWVDGASGTGSFNLTVTLDSPVYPPSNDTCASPIALTRGVPAQGDTSAATNANGGGPLAASCSRTASGATALTASDLVYSFTPTVSQTFWVTLTPATGFNAVLWATETVCGGDGRACFAAARGTTAQTLTVTGTAGTTYYFIVDGVQGQVGAFSLLVQ